MRPFLAKKLQSRLRLLGKDRAALHAVVPPAVLPPEFGGTAKDSFGWLLDEMEAAEKSTGMIGGWCVPFNWQDPAGEKRAAAAGAVAAARGPLEGAQLPADAAHVIE